MPCVCSQASLKGRRHSEQGVFAPLRFVRVQPLYQTLCIDRVGLDIPEHHSLIWGQCHTPHVHFLQQAWNSTSMTEVASENVCKAPGKQRQTELLNHTTHRPAFHARLAWPLFVPFPPRRPAGLLEMARGWIGVPGDRRSGTQQ